VVSAGLGSLGNLGSLWRELDSLPSGGLPGLLGFLTGLENSLTGVVNSLLPGLPHRQFGGSMGTGFTGVFGPDKALLANTSSNFQSLLAGRLAGPYPFVGQVGANWVH
jgi:hypothetical protein